MPTRSIFRPTPAAESGESRGAPIRERFLSLLSLNEAPLLRAFRHGVMLVMPLLLAAAIAILANNFPLAAYQHFMDDVFGSGWKLPGAAIYNASIEILALATTFTLSNCLMELHNQQRPEQAVLPVLGTLTAFSCLFIMIGPGFSPDGMILPWAGIRGLFGSLVITFLSCKLFLLFCRFKSLRLSYYSEGADPVLPQMFDVLAPTLLTLAAFLALQEALVFLGVESLHKAFYEAIRGLFDDAHDSFGLGALYAFLVQLCWFFGIHGADLLDPITHHVLIKGMEVNSLAINNHLPPPHIFTKYFFDVYIYMGGAGTTLALLAAVFLRSDDKGARRVAAISLVPGIFNINELLVFGLPVVLNPAFLIPFVCVPLVLLLISYAAVSAGLAPVPVYQVDWITPPLINAYISTDSWSGVALQVFNMAVATLIYCPFVALADKVKVVRRRKTFEELAAIAEDKERAPAGARYMDLPGAPGALARSLANEMDIALRDRDESLHLCYQPRVDVVSKTVPCVEALLRWELPFYGQMPVPLALAIAAEAGLTRRLENSLVQMAFEQQVEWRKNGIFTVIAVNISENQLRDQEFPQFLDYLYTRYSLPADAILLELNESLVLDANSGHARAIEALSATGVGVAVDDFGKIYQSIAHLKRLPLSELQIDRNIIKDIDRNRLNQDVLAGIQETAGKLGIRTSAEYVENAEQLEVLLELNFSSFQGYWFSPAISAAKCADFIRSFPAQQVFDKNGEETSPLSNETGVVTTPHTP